ncbi:MAG: GAF domain-containing protein [Verrucomicrobiales bacterium]|nr:GAF domain-containing protein [Verrucomicrobiales bacterium]
MNRNRLKFLNNPIFTQLGTDVEKHIESWINSSSPAETAGLLDEVCLDILSRVYKRIGGSEGTVWLADSDQLTAVYNSGPNADEIVGFQQPIGSGIISMVYAQQQPYCENEISSKSGHDDTLDRQTHKSTRAMVVIPFYFAFGLRGVISCVQLQDNGSPEPSGFESSDVEQMVRAGNNVERLVNGKLLSVALGFDES